MEDEHQEYDHHDLVHHQDDDEDDQQQQQQSQQHQQQQQQQQQQQEDEVVVDPAVVDDQSLQQQVHDQVHQHHHLENAQSYNEQELMPHIERAVNAVNAFNRTAPDSIQVGPGPNDGGPLDPAVLADHADVVLDQAHLDAKHHDDQQQHDEMQHHDGQQEDDEMGHHEDEDGEPSRKKRKLKPSAPRVSRACLVCRRQKMRCEGAENPPCKRCRNGGHQCVFESNKKDYLKEIKDSASWQRQVENKIDSLTSTLTAILEALERHGIPVMDQRDQQQQQQHGDDQSQDGNVGLQLDGNPDDVVNDSSAYLVDH